MQEPLEVISSSPPSTAKPHPRLLFHTLHTLGYVIREQAVLSCPALPCPVLSLSCPVLSYPIHLMYPAPTDSAATVTASAQRVYRDLKLLVVGASRT